ncbi:MAG: class I SAM-dependent methyltransferase [Lysobacterales bacterium]
MTGPSQWILRAYLRRKSRHAPPATGARIPPEDYVRAQYDSTPRLLAMLPGFDPSGKDIVSIGCGLGGRAAYLATRGARSVLGVDIDAADIDGARRWCAELYPETRGVLSFRHVGEDEPLPSESVDIAMMFDSIEHVRSPVAVVRRAFDALRPGGVLYAGSIGWYSPSGSHTGLFPWVNVFFSDEDILNAIRWRLVQPWYRPVRHDSDPPVRRWEWIYDLADRPGEHLNKITLAEVSKLLKYSKFSRTALHVYGIGQGSRIGRFTAPLARVPLLREMFHGYFVVECHKG